ncbi:MAG: hypothetical protein EOP48_00465 [Sphingobacteriales bacterium]|nr:MAG: hypothetical protein EOP48_00465 [Sphingobacteriales bacterium]
MNKVYQILFAIVIFTACTAKKSVQEQVKHPKTCINLLNAKDEECIEEKCIDSSGIPLACDAINSQCADELLKIEDGCIPKIQICAFGYLEDRGECIKEEILCDRALSDSSSCSPLPLTPEPSVLEDKICEEKETLIGNECVDKPLSSCAVGMESINGKCVAILIPSRTCEGGVFLDGVCRLICSVKLKTDVVKWFNKAIKGKSYFLSKRKNSSKYSVIVESIFGFDLLEFDHQKNLLTSNCDLTQQVVAFSGIAKSVTLYNDPNLRNKLSVCSAGEPILPKLFLDEFVGPKDNTYSLQFHSDVLVCGSNIQSEKKLYLENHLPVANFYSQSK